MHGWNRRYRALTLWNKVGFWGAIASLIGLAVTLLPFVRSINETDRKSSGSIRQHTNEGPESAQSQREAAPAIHVGASGPANSTTGPRSPIITDTKSGDVSIIYGK